jgi:hypothetical protein
MCERFWLKKSSTNTTFSPQNVKLKTDVMLINYIIPDKNKYFTTKN